jgi:hypothetical protein
MYESSGASQASQQLTHRSHLFFLPIFFDAVMAQLTVILMGL